VSAVPAEIAGIGSTQQKLRVSPSFDPLKAAVEPEEYFVLSRIDGVQRLREVLLTTGLPVDRAISIVQRLRAIGALLLPGEAAAATPPGAPAGKRADRTAPTAVRGSGATPVSGPSGPATARLRPVANSQAAAPATSFADPVHDLALPGITAVEQAALREDIALDDPSRRRILAMARLCDGRDPWALLGVPVGTEALHLKRAYFKLSKAVHPDRFFGQQLGSFTRLLPVVFEALSRAHGRLTNPGRAPSEPRAGAVEQPQTPQEYAGELFERACQLEIGGDHLGAMKLFAAAVRVDSQARYLRRAASCALAAGQPRSAVEYAKKAYALAPNDPSASRLLAAAFRSAGKLADAEEVLVMAMAMKSENDIVTSELRHDLAEVRRLLAQSSA
jgi:tetratricopeptide (TPR) repeat protein